MSNVLKSVYQDTINGLKTGLQLGLCVSTLSFLLGTAIAIDLILKNETDDDWSSYTRPNIEKAAVDCTMNAVIVPVVTGTIGAFAGGAKSIFSKTLQFFSSAAHPRIQNGGAERSIFQAQS